MKHYLIAFIILFSIVKADPIQVHTMSELESYFADADTKTLAIFDVDMVLVQPEDPAFQMPNIKRFGATAKQIMGQLPNDKQMLFLALMTVSSKTILLDKELPGFFQTLATRSIPAIALTANLTGSFSGIENMEKWRAETLRDLGIDFSKTSPHKDSFVFTELASFRNNYSTYVDGMVFVNGKEVLKGDALIAFFNKTKPSYTRIIFVDDREDNVKSVEEAAKALGLDCKAIHYLGAQNYPSVSITEEQFESQWNKLAKAVNSL